MSDDTILRIEDLHVTYRLAHRDVHALQGASLQVGPSEIVGIVGESGSGKSTIARAALGLLPERVAECSGGRIVIRGEDVTHVSAKRWVRLRGHPVAIVFQDPLSFLNPVMRVDKQIGEATHKHDPASVGPQRVRELLDLVRLPGDVATSYPHELSGGMRQRVLLAVALACKPDLLIADEPTTALDVTTQAEIIKLLREIQSTLRMSVLLISHNLAVVAEICERIYVMYAGRTVESGRTQDVLETPGHPYTFALMRAARNLRTAGGRFATVDGEAPNLSEEFAGCPFAERCPVVLDRCSVDTPIPLVVGGRTTHEASCWQLVTRVGAHDR